MKGPACTIWDMHCIQGQHAIYRLQVFKSMQTVHSVVSDIQRVLRTGDVVIRFARCPTLSSFSQVPQSTVFIACAYMVKQNSGCSQLWFYEYPNQAIKRNVTARKHWFEQSKLGIPDGAAYYVAKPNLWLYCARVIKSKSVRRSRPTVESLNRTFGLKLH